MSATVSDSTSPAQNGHSEDGHKSRHRSRSREKRRDRSSSRHRSSHKDRDYRERDGDPDRRKSGRDDRDRDRDKDREHRRRRSRSYDRDRDYDRERRRDRDRERGEDRGDRERDRRRKRDDSADAEDRHPESKRRKDDPEDKKMDLDVPAPKTLNGASSPVSPAASDRRERERRSPTASSRRSGRDAPSPRRGDRDRDFDRDRRRPDYDDRRRNDRSPYGRPPPRPRRPSPGYDPRPHDIPPPDEDSEARSVFVSQLAARLTARDLGYFFEDKLGEGTVIDSRIVTDRVSRRSKGIAYVELASIELVNKAIALSGTVVMGLPIMVQLTESERNKVASAGDSLNLPPGVTAPPVGMQLYVGSLHFNLSESDIKQVFEPFGELDFVDLHKDPQTGRSKGYAFVQYKRSEDAKMALEQMDGFELAGRQLRVNTVHEKNSLRGIIGGGGGIQQDSLDEGGGTNLTNVSRQALMQKLARTDVAPTIPAPIMRPANIPTTQKSRCILLRNMFNPEEETEPDWHRELEADVKDECESKYGGVDGIKVEVESQGEIYMKFATVEAATQALEGLNGRWFGGRQVSAAYISDAIYAAHQ